MKSGAAPLAHAQNIRDKAHSQRLTRRPESAISEIKAA